MLYVAIKRTLSLLSAFYTPSEERYSHSRYGAGFDLMAMQAQNCKRFSVDFKRFSILYLERIQNISITITIFFYYYFLSLHSELNMSTVWNPIRL